MIKISRHPISLKDVALFLSTALAFMALILWNYCLLTFCKTISLPAWLSEIYFMGKIPFLGNFIFATIFVAPLALTCDRHATGVTTYLVVPSLISALKHIVILENDYLLVNLIFDYLMAFIPIVIAFYLVFLSRKLVLKSGAKKILN